MNASKKVGTWNIYFINNRDLQSNNQRVSIIQNTLP